MADSKVQKQDQQIRIIGVPFDPPNSPERLNMKLAYVSHLVDVRQPCEMFHDPYDAIEADLRGESSLCCENVWLGKMPIESWITPRPDPKDVVHLTPVEAGSFLEANGCWDYALKVAEFVENRVLPDMPVMIGVDHSSTGGALMALAQRHSNLNVVVLDAHFDVMKLYGPGWSFKTGTSEGDPPFYHCGNFLRHVLEKEIILPQNLWVLGVGDEMLARSNHGCDTGRFTNNEREVRRWVDEGVHLFSRSMVSSGRVSLDLNGPTYVSIDMDVGSLSSVFSARFMNCYGLTKQEFLDLVKVVHRSIREAGISLVGLDIMEIDIHFLEAVETVPFRDCSRYIVKKALETLLTVGSG